MGFSAVRSGRNIHAVIGKGRPALLLNSHLDTVPANPSWTRDPFKPRRIGDRLYGLGASDAKASLAAMLSALPMIAQRVKRRGGKVVFAATCDEETGGKGLEVLLPRLGRMDAAVIGEPTACDPYTGQRGLVILKATARGRSAHASRPQRGINALEIAARDILNLGKLRLRRHPLMGAGSVAATMIQGGTRRNVIPAACEFWIDIRTTPRDPNASVVRRVSRLLVSEVTVHSMRLDAVETSPREPIVRAAQAAHPGGRPGALMGTSDLVFCAKRGIPGVILGPGFPRLSHAPDEYVTDGQLRKAATLYPLIVDAYLSRA
jgi:acetylornithine deacetylase